MARTLADLYAERPLTEQQARRIVALLGLTGRQDPGNDDGAEGATSAPPVESRYQHAS
ncbi:hypothetical protein [Streptomyces sp. NPDC086023]|uniref:hypothetical protein n=1 Tax=Streptomyces sp. NPDC086023 TaxID=3365746 RepID=UPI0037CE74F1